MVTDSAGGLLAVFGAGGQPVLLSQDAVDAVGVMPVGGGDYLVLSEGLPAGWLSTAGVAPGEVGLTYVDWSGDVMLAGLLDGGASQPQMVLVPAVAAVIIAALALLTAACGLQYNVWHGTCEDMLHACETVYGAGNCHIESNGQPCLYCCHVVTPAGPSEDVGGFWCNHSPPTILPPDPPVGPPSGSRSILW